MVKQRWTALSGIVFVVLMLTGAFFVIDVPAPDASTQEIAGYLADSGNHTRNIVGAYLWVLGGLAFLGFVAGLRAVLRRAEGDPGSSRAWSSVLGSSSPRSGVSRPWRSRPSPTPSVLWTRP
jgi:hypothetical protein